MSSPKKRKAVTPPVNPSLQRELYTLVGEQSLPTLVASKKHQFKPSWRQKVTPWLLLPFENNARTDGLQLQHWVHGEHDAQEAYKFARFNTHVQLPEWTDEDYALFKSDEWSLEETRYLFDLCEAYDLNWHVIHDRYVFENAHTLEDLKERFYEVSRALLRKNPNLSPAEEELLAAMDYSKRREQTRKEHLARLLARTPEEVAEEEQLLLESRRLEALASKFLGDREELFRLLDSQQGSGSVAAYQSSQGLAQLHQQLMAEKSRKPEQRRSDERNLVNQIMQRKVSSKEEMAYGVVFNDRHQPGVYLRSAKLLQLKQSTAQKTLALLQELGVPPRPAMSTQRVCASFEALQHSVSALLETKKNLDRVETEVRILKAASEASKATEADGVKEQEQELQPKQEPQDVALEEAQAQEPKEQEMEVDS